MKADLFYKDSGSDKVYHCQIEDNGDGTAVVNFQYGRRGSTLTTGTKTEKPVPMEKARAIFDKLVREKQAKGYSPGETGAKYQHTDREQRYTGIHAQLLNEIGEEDVVNYINDPAWGAQEKHDGKRILVIRDGATVTGVNRSGLSVGIPDAVVEAALRLSSDQFVLDGEGIGDSLFVFDLLQLNRVDFRATKEPYSVRLALLRELCNDLDDGIHVTQTVTGTHQKAALLVLLRNNKAEGVVFKRMDAPSIPGRPHSGGNQLKYKFYATASCMVERQNDDGKHSVSLKLLDGKKWVSVGNVTIPQGTILPSPGQIVEIRYLYAYKGGSLYQPIFEGIRDDIKVKDCKLSQLKYKREQEEE